MKKVVISVLLAILTVFSFTVPALAQESDPVVAQIIENENGSTVFFYANGSTLTISPVKIEEQTVSPLATTKTVTGAKTITYKDAGGNLEWEYTLYGTFSCVAGVSVTCTNSYYSQKIVKGSWSFSDGSAWKSANEARGTGKYTFKVLFITVRTYNITINVSCDSYGNMA